MIARKEGGRIMDLRAGTRRVWRKEPGTMAWDADNGIFGLDQECPLHGDEPMVECRMCGSEFCRSCHPGSRICPDCAEAEGVDDEIEDIDEEGEEGLDPDVAEVIDADFGDFGDLDEGDEVPKRGSSGQE
jgi:hypothetical protein